MFSKNWLYTLKNSERWRNRQEKACATIYWKSYILCNIIEHYKKQIPLWSDEKIKKIYIFSIKIHPSINHFVLWSRAHDAPTTKDSNPATPYPKPPPIRWIFLQILIDLHTLGWHKIFQPRFSLWIWQQNKSIIKFSKKHPNNLLNKQNYWFELFTIKIKVIMGVVVT